MLDGKKIEVLLCTQQDTLYFGSLNKAWGPEEFKQIVLQVLTDVASIDFVMLKDVQQGQKQQNRGFAFVKFSSYVAAYRAQRVASQPDFCLGNLHPIVQWAKEEPEVDQQELSEVKIAIVRSLPADADEDFLKQLFEHFGKVEKVVVSKKSSFPVIFVHFTERSSLDKSVKTLNEKMIQGGRGSMLKLQVEVARPMDKSKKRALDNAESHPFLQGRPKSLKEEPNPIFSNRRSFAQKHEIESMDPYEDEHDMKVDSVEKDSGKTTNLSDFDPEIQTIVSLSNAYGAEGELGIVLSKKLMEQDACSMFDALISGGGGVFAIREFSLHPVNSQSGFLPITEASASLYHLLSLVDSFLYCHLIDLGVEPQFFVLRWLRVLFESEFSLEDLLIWDEIFACKNAEDADSSFGVLESPRSVFVSCFAVPMILHLRSSLFATKTTTSCLQRLLNFPNNLKLVKLIITKAKSLQNLAANTIKSTSLPVHEEKKPAVNLCWCLCRSFINRLPPSSATFTCMESIEAFALDANHLRYITEHFRIWDPGIREFLTFMINL